MTRHFHTDSPAAGLTPPVARGAAELFAGPGEMRALCRAFDWASTPLGPVERWSQSLRTTAGLVLASRNPMFLWWGPELVQLYNDAYRPSLGQGARHPGALGARGREFWTDIWEVIGPQIELVMTAGEATWHEDQYLPIERNGRLDDVWWTYSYSPVRDDDGRITGTLVVCQETTQRVLGEQERERLLGALDVERARLAHVFQQAPAFLAVLRGPTHVFELVNEAYYQLVGHRQLIGRAAFDAMPELRDQGFDRLLDEVLAAGEPFVGREVPMHVARTPGAAPEERFVTFVYLPMIEADGTRAGIIAHGTDVTAQVVARREVERLLGESERARADAEGARERTERLQGLTAALAGARSMDDVATVVVADMVGALGARTGALAARAAEGDALVLLRTVGFPDPLSAGIRRQPIGLQTPLAQCFRTLEPVWVESREGPGGLDATYPLIAPLWEELGVNSAAFIPLIAAGEPVGVISFAFESPRSFEPEERAYLLALGQQAALAMDRARLFDAEHVARQDAETANRAKAEFLAVMSHELRTPLNAIGGYAELMEMGIGGAVADQHRDYLARIQRSQRHLLGLVNEVLNYAKIETGTVHYDLADLPMSPALAEAEGLVAPQAGARGLALEVRECPRDLKVRADAEKLRQVLVNLLSNAVKFTDEGGRITVSCTDLGERVAISVRDTGIGIPADQLEAVFEPFVQVQRGLTRAVEGTGLGLAISRDLARGMGGDLTAESRVGEGSVFTLLLPRA